MPKKELVGKITFEEIKAQEADVAITGLIDKGILKSVSYGLPINLDIGKKLSAEVRAETGEDLEINITPSVARVCLTRKGKRVCGVFNKGKLKDALSGLSLGED